MELTFVGAGITFVVTFSLLVWRGRRSSSGQLASWKTENPEYYAMVEGIELEDDDEEDDDEGDSERNLFKELDPWKRHEYERIDTNDGHEFQCLVCSQTFTRHHEAVRHKRQHYDDTFRR